MDRPAPTEALANRDAILRAFIGADGRLSSIPTKLTKRLVILDHIAQSFEPGIRYTEAEVNDVMHQFHPDHAALRRYLVENELLERDAGVYWRAGGTTSS
ncbi:DUF2087 domain-containing protein [Knoellia sp. S7-12]|uniref:DUF2087 domain-containing protein n=1 Tax=Knoellia sp. S7-12 TaxID=3126698 RepID=UPI0033682032